MLLLAALLMSSVILMAPKKGAAKKTVGKKKDVDTEDEPKPEKTDKTQQSNFMNQLKGAERRLREKTSVNPEEDANKTALLVKYNSLSLRDPKKQELVAKWLKDKSCAWWGTYSNSEFKSSSSSHDAYQGHGTKFAPQLFISFICADFYFRTMVCFYPIVSSQVSMRRHLEDSARCSTFGCCSC